MQLGGCAAGPGLREGERHDEREHLGVRMIGEVLVQDLAGADDCTQRERARRCRVVLGREDGGQPALAVDEVGREAEIGEPPAKALVDALGGVPRERAEIEVIQQLGRQHAPQLHRERGLAAEDALPQPVVYVAWSCPGGHGDRSQVRFSFRRPP
jgi:hypothetical protein